MPLVDFIDDPQIEGLLRSEGIGKETDNMPRRDVPTRYDLLEINASFYNAKREAIRKVAKHIMKDYELLEGTGISQKVCLHGLAENGIIVSLHAPHFSKRYNDGGVNIRFTTPHKLEEQYKEAGEKEAEKIRGIIRNSVKSHK